MPYKSRSKSTELLILEYLNRRMRLSDQEKTNYYSISKGFEGELRFDSMTDTLQCECLILNDLLLKLNNTLFQIDSLIITPEAIYCFEVKNYEGDYVYESDRFYKKSKSEITNPLTQLNRSESLFRQLLQGLDINFPIHAFVVFINSEFTLYQTPLNKPLIFSTQINRFLKNLSTKTTNLTTKQRNLADKLISLHITDSPFKQLPSYNYEELRKGITCFKCSSFSISVSGMNCYCEDCGQIELVSSSVMRSVKEFKLLFPNQKVTTSLIHEWCQVVQSKKRIMRILEKNFEKVGTHQWSYYK
ncbi:nuclease-related domain-containing protein [Litchfieldia salsa]|uniref:Nuclease-related domain-containing protein n=1 Tax=Litchfieldia salsa TaxID=930152 RepID=A0A1H0UPE6_9BACI|nr:nuclease-related domain-containing protein [Litchfieldia salsa]SDP67973.1 Nuclease-related domain-containing protein [Litchfieldia salsa]